MCNAKCCPTGPLSEDELRIKLEKARIMAEDERKLWRESHLPPSKWPRRLTDPPVAGGEIDPVLGEYGWDWIEDPDVLPGGHDSGPDK